MDMFQFLFLERDWERDRAAISRFWEHFARLNWPVQLMLFPEGTDYNAGSIEKSRTFTEARGERPFKHVLAPRVAGFAHCVKESRARRLLRAILDVTIAYETNVPQSELAFLQGKLPTAIHFHVERIDVSDINEAKLEQMLFARWRRKDELLTRFAAKNRLNNEPLTAQPMPVPMLLAPALWLCVTLGGIYAICVSHFLLAWFLMALAIMALACFDLLPIRLGDIEKAYVSDAIEPSA
jgi:1-acyl-sn-glycerol-3-phosphate acyltransferase